MKKFAIAMTTLATVALIASTSIAWDCPGRGAGYGPGSGKNVALTQEDKEAREIFMTETVDLRKDLAAKRGQLNAIMAAEAPDAEKAAEVSKQIFEIREQLRAKATQAGINGPYSYGQGCQGSSYRGQGGRGYCGR